MLRLPESKDTLSAMVLADPSTVPTAAPTMSDDRHPDVDNRTFPLPFQAVAACSGAVTSAGSGASPGPYHAT